MNLNKKLYLETYSNSCDYCIYRFIGKNNKIIYIGMTRNLKSRMEKHKNMFFYVYGQIIRIEYTKLDSLEEMIHAEKYYITKFKPTGNTNNKNYHIHKDDKLDFNGWSLYAYYPIREIIEEINNLINSKISIPFNLSKLWLYKTYWMLQENTMLSWRAGAYPMEELFSMKIGKEMDSCYYELLRKINYQIIKKYKHIRIQSFYIKMTTCNMEIFFRNKVFAIVANIIDKYKGYAEEHLLYISIEDKRTV